MLPICTPSPPVLRTSGTSRMLDAPPHEPSRQLTRFPWPQLRMGREDFLAWCAAAAPPSALTASPDAAFHTLLAATHVLLGPAVDEYRSCLAGDLAHALVRCLPARAAAQPHLSGLLEGCSRKLVASNHSSLVSIAQRT